MSLLDIQPLDQFILEFEDSLVRSTEPEIETVVNEDLEVSNSGVGEALTFEADKESAPLSSDPNYRVLTLESTPEPSRTLGDVQESKAVQEDIFRANLPVALPISDISPPIDPPTRPYSLPTSINENQSDIHVEQLAEPQEVDEVNTV